MNQVLLFAVIDGSSELMQITSGSGFAKLNESYGLRVYSIAGKIIASEDGFSTIQNVPTPFYAGALCQTSGSDFFDPTLGQPVFGGITIIGSPSGLVRYSSVPETSSSWREGTQLTSGFRCVDAIAGNDDAGPLLIGNGRVAITTRVMRETLIKPRFDHWVDSSSGLPTSGLASGVTDLEIAQ